jgi:hypothetical protein
LLPDEGGRGFESYLLRHPFTLLQDCCPRAQKELGSDERSLQLSISFSQRNRNFLSRLDPDGLWKRRGSMRHIRVASHVSLQPDLGRGGVGDGRGTRGSGGPKWHASVEPVFSLRACGARPPRNGQGIGTRPSGGKPGITLGAVFSEGRTLCARVVRPSECGDISFPPDDEAKGPWPKGDMPRSSPCHLLRACRARPSKGGPSAS